MYSKETSEKNFIGRKNEIEVLKRLILEAESGDASSIFLAGTRGSGKTSLLKRLYGSLFDLDEGPVPFFYSVHASCTSLEQLSKDYFEAFVLQCLAFIQRDPSLVETGFMSLDDLRDLAVKSDAQAVIDLMNRYLDVIESNDSLKLFSYVMSAPLSLYLKTERPVAVMLDDFHNIRSCPELAARENSPNLRASLETLILSGSVPHIISGNQADLTRMFFRESAFGNRMDVINISGLNRKDYAALCNMLCRTYGLGFEGGSTEVFSQFNGNPFYIRSYIQTARQAGTSLSRDDAWEIYFKEVTQGKFRSYWTSLLESYIPQVELRRPALHFLWFLLTNDNDIALTSLTEELTKKQDDLDKIIEHLKVSGVLESGFSTFEIAADPVLVDVIKGLYLKEVRGEPVDAIREEITGRKSEEVITHILPSFDVTVPPDPKAELVAVKSLEQIARHHNMPPGAIGQLQVALVELFANILTREPESSETCYVSFNVNKGRFSMSIETPETGNDYLSPEYENAFRMIKYYVDDVQVEKDMNSTRIILSKNISSDVTAQ